MLTGRRFCQISWGECNPHLLYFTFDAFSVFCFCFETFSRLIIILSKPFAFFLFFSVVTLASFCGNFFPFILNCLHQLKNLQVSSPPSQIFSHRPWLGFLSDLVLRWVYAPKPQYSKKKKKKHTDTQNLFFQKYFLG